MISDFNLNLYLRGLMCTSNGKLHLRLKPQSDTNAIEAGYLPR